MMSREPQPSNTAEKSRFSMTAVTAIHQRREKAVASVGAIFAGVTICTLLVRREGQGEAAAWSLEVRDNSDRINILN